MLNRDGGTLHCLIFLILKNEELYNKSILHDSATLIGRTVVLVLCIGVSVNFWI